MDQYEAAKVGDLVRVQELVTASNVNIKGRQSWMVLHLACKGGHHHVVEWLIRLGADMSAPARGWTALHLAALSSPTCVGLLLAAGADPAIQDHEWAIPLHWADRLPECAALLIAAHPAGVRAVDKVKQSPLHRATQRAATDAVKLLLAAGSVVDAFDSYGRSSLYFALSKGDRKVAAMLLDGGAQLEHVKLVDPLKSIPQWAISMVASRDACRSASWALIGLARRRSRVIGGNTRDVLRLIVRMVWDSRWSNIEAWE